MLRAVGDSVSPFLYMVAGCVTNIVLDVVFVVLFHWGIAGVAIATVAAQMVNMSLLTRKLLTTKESYALSLRELKLNGVYLSNMLKMGIPSGLQSSMYAVSNMIIQVAVNTLGTVVVASWAMTSKTDGIYWAVSNALGAAITSFIGQNLGAGRTDRARECVKQGMTLAMIITLAISGGIMLAAKPLLSILTNDPDVISTTYEMMTYFVPFYFTWTAIEVLSAVLRGAGDAVNPVIIIALGICLFRIVWIATVFASIGTLASLCWCYVASWTVTSIALIIYYKKGGWIKRRRMVIHN
jgi:putative MATE family efflux protein